MEPPVTAGPDGLLEPAEHFGPQAKRLSFERGTDGPRVIVVGVDGSPIAARAGAYAVGLARRQHAQLVVVFVAPTIPFAVFSGLAAAAVLSTVEELAGELRREVRRAAEELDVPVTFVVRRGDVFAHLRETANLVKADMVVVGASAKAGHRFVGSVATRLVRLGSWPVVVVP